ncbi:MAG: patatin-like phospholipase family protein [Cohaesibacteraceae bacterium]
METFKLALVLSGGGVRAVAFHTGVVRWLFAEGHNEKIEEISSVSGGSIFLALLLHFNRRRFPKNQVELEAALQGIQELVTSTSFQARYILRSLLDVPTWIECGANHLSSVLKEIIGIDFCISELPRKPKCWINATNYESGANWFFTDDRMGDWRFGYVHEPCVPLAEAVAASAGYPFYIGALRLNTKGARFVGYDGSDAGPTAARDSVWLWDGGVYENTGLERFHKPGRGLRSGISRLLVSDASGHIVSLPRKNLLLQPFLSPRRLVEIVMSQTRALRARLAVAEFIENKNGLYFQIGANTKDFYDLDEYERKKLDESGAFARSFKTNLKKMTDDEFNNISKYAFDIAKNTQKRYQIL